MSKNTLAAYKNDLAKYFGYLSRLGASVEGVTAELVQDFVVTLSESGLKSTSCARILAAVRGFHRFLLLENLRTDDPTARLRPIKLPMRLPKALSQDQVLKLLAASGPEPTDESADPIGLRNRAILELMYSSGARVSEIVDLDLDEIVGQGLMRVRGKGAKERIVPIGSYALKSLDAYLIRTRPLLNKKTGLPALFLNQRGGRLSRQSIWEVIQKAGKACELAVSPHTLRHCFATHLIEGGADVRVVQELLGHSSVATTQIYTMVTIDTLREVYHAAHPRAQR
ncbi:site-specific tyrosine recombinase XerD [Candidatus Aquiluna sp. UB-MaderosW2red]|uniref:site-specific tyrosine recombinase XerD n=1 Tax=Candidatus Aquiluna sp. UB-MaderosW2red TaxID=1855377 RepID=UPI00201DAD08